VRVTVIDVIEALNRGGQMTVAEIVEATRMNVDTVRDTIATLSKYGWVYPCGLKSSVPGKMKAIVWKSAVHRSVREDDADGFRNIGNANPVKRMNDEEGSHYPE
jgi:hypothetical protein